MNIPMMIIVFLSATCAVLLLIVLKTKKPKSNLELLNIKALAGKRIKGVVIKASENKSIKAIHLHCHDLTTLILRHDEEGLNGIVLNWRNEDEYKEIINYFAHLKKESQVLTEIWHDKDKSEEKEFTELFHRLWTRDNGPSYKKRDWQKLGELANDAGLFNF